MIVTDYLNLIPSANRLQPNFLAVITADVSIQVQVQALLSSMIPIFDLDTPPVGSQLDVIGQWVGISRNVNIPITGIYFTWDGTPSVGWDSGTWAIPGSKSTITVLPDDAYLTLILGKIAANKWDGTTNGAYRVWNEFFTNITILIQDYENMSYAMGIVGSMISPLTLALITGGYIPLRPEGIEITGYFSGPSPFFSWDTPNGSLLAGWDMGLWAAFSPPT